MPGRLLIERADIMTDENYRLNDAPEELDAIIKKITGLLDQDWQSRHYIEINRVLVVLNQATADIREIIDD